METLLILAIIGGGLYYLSTRSTKQKTAEIETAQLEDAQADARRWIERLGSQVLTIAGNDTASTQAIADASERYNAAASAISTATTVRQAQLARESALEGLHYMNAAREIMGMTPGPELPLLEGQRNAGKVTERRTIEQDGQVLTASPVATDETPNYYPGGNVAGRPVPAGWYSRPWWADAMATGMWTAASMMMFSAMFSGMAGVNYGANEFASGAGDGTEAADMGDLGDAGDMGDMGGGDFGGGDAGGGFFDGGFDFDF